MLLECIVDSFCMIWSLKFGCVVVAFYQLCFWMFYALPLVLTEECYPKSVVRTFLYCTPVAAGIGFIGAFLLIYGLIKKMPSWTLTWCMYTQNFTMLYSLLAGHLMIHAVSLFESGCPSQYLVGVLHVVQIAWQCYTVMCIHSLYVHLESDTYCCDRINARPPC